ncbi:MAG: HD domain-containing protein [Dehalococcoidia bacterium]|nr:HD domain-containing protein [Dehalococcoidia bacterium]
MHGVTLVDLEPLLGLRVGRAVIEELRTDAVWMRLRDDRLSAVLAAQAPGEGRPSHQHVERVAAAMCEVVDAAVREPGRSERVGSLAMALGKQLGLEPAYLRALRIAGLLLDIGQLGVPHSITEKPAILSIDEMELMRRHLGWAARWLDGLPGFAEIAHWIEAHHERPDGRGYPDQLTAAELSLASRILAVADAYWALCAERPYRAALSPAQAVAVIEGAAGQQFDASAAEARSKRATSSTKTVAPPTRTSTGAMAIGPLVSNGSPSSGRSSRREWHSVRTSSITSSTRRLATPLRMVALPRRRKPPDEAILVAAISLAIRAARRRSASALETMMTQSLVGLAVSGSVMRAPASARHAGRVRHRCALVCEMLLSGEHDGDGNADGESGEGQ